MLTVPHPIRSPRMLTLWVYLPDLIAFTTIASTVITAVVCAFA